MKKLLANIKESRNTNADFYCTNLDHLMDEVARIDLIVRKQIEHWRKYAKNQDFPGLYISEEEIDDLLSKEYSVSEDFSEIESLSQKIAKKKEASMQKGIELRLELIRSMFNLVPLEIDAILLVLASELDLKYRKLFAYLQDDITKKKPTVGLILELFCKSKEAAITAREHFSYTSPLVKNLLFHLEDDDIPLLEKGVKLDDRIMNFLLGSNELDSNIASFTSLRHVQGEVYEAALPEDLKTQLRKAARLNTNSKPVFLLHGSSPQVDFAAAFCAETGISLLVISLGKIKDEILRISIRLPLREAMLQKAAVYLENFDAISDEARSIAIEEIKKYDGIVFVPSKMDLYIKKKTFRISIPKLSHQTRIKTWQSLVGDFEGIDQIASRFKFGRNKAIAAVKLAKSRALFRDPNNPVLTLNDLYEGCRAQSSSIPYTVKIKPKYTWEDIVLPFDGKEQLREICNYVKNYAKVYEVWDFEKHSRGKGLNILFSGPSGTGKTMAADIIANELRLDLYKIDLSMLVSKYIGETEKNLNMIFKGAEECNAILFFDEADALFGKRSEVKDAHDRYANVEINYLLQKMEEHEGTVVLATNMSKNIDDAFLRRMNFIVEFPFPNEEYRLTIWQKIFPEKTPVDKIDFDFLSKLQISGGNIKNIALTAAFLAAESSANVKMEHIVKAAKREFQKTGKVYGKEEFGKYYELIK